MEFLFQILEHKYIHSNDLKPIDLIYKEDKDLILSRRAGGLVQGLNGSPNPCSQPSYVPQDLKRLVPAGMGGWREAASSQVSPKPLQLEVAVLGGPGRAHSGLLERELPTRALCLQPGRSVLCPETLPLRVTGRRAFPVRALHHLPRRSAPLLAAGSWAPVRELSLQVTRLSGFPASWVACPFCALQGHASGGGQGT